MRPQKRRFLKGELEAEILGETVGIAPNCLVEALRQNAVERSQVAIEYDALAADGSGRNGTPFRYNTQTLNAGC